jgi:hypothetical protein
VQIGPQDSKKHHAYNCHLREHGQGEPNNRIDIGIAQRIVRGVVDSRQ